MSLLEIRGLRTHLQGPDGVARAVEGVDLDVGEGEAVGVVGESGSGKTLLALSILGLLPVGVGRILPGSSVKLRGRDLLNMAPGALQRVRGKEVAMIFQEPMTSLNPVFRVGGQIRESVELHRALRGGEARDETLRLLREVGIPDPEHVAGAYPHQLSGGIRQRAMIAMALAGEPGLLVADEPTTALDVTVQAQILDLLKDLQERRGMGLLFISHDLGAVARVCERVVVLYGGRVMEEGPTEEVLDHPRHPYTRGLLGSRLSLRDRRREARPIPGEVPEATRWPPGCPFHPRCGEVLDRCRLEEPPMVPLTSGSGRPAREGGRGEGLADAGEREVRCWLLAGGDEGEKGVGE